MANNGPADQEPVGAYRPSLVKLVGDVSNVEDELLAGFPSRRDVLRWSQRLTVRTLGTIDDDFYRALGRQFRYEQLGEDGEQRRQGVLLAALLEPGARSRELPETGVRELRTRLAAVTIRPASHRAFRVLRKSAGEYIDDSAGAEHDPARQLYVAMRPELTELDDRQADVLAALLDGFGELDDVLKWGDDLELATHGEVPEDYIKRCVTERSTRRVLLGGSREYGRARELIAAYQLIPRFNAGVRVLVDRAVELPAAIREDRGAKAL